MTQFSSGSDFKDPEKNQVYWFRDYWSDRKGLGRNIMPEGLGWKNSEEFDMESLGPGEFEIEKNADGSTSAKDLEKKQVFLGLADPVDLVRRYEPRNMIIRAANELSRTITNQAPHEFFGLANYLDRKLGGEPAQEEPPASVQEEPVASMSSDLKRFSLFNPLISYPIGLIFALLLFEFAPNSALLLKIVIYAGFALFGALVSYSAIVRRSQFAVEHFFYTLLIVFFFLFVGIWLVSEYIFTFLPFLKILFYIFLGLNFVLRMTDEIVADVMKAYRMVFLYNGEEPAKFHYSHSEDVPNWLGSKPYWVFQYLFLWRGEFTFHRKFPFFHFKPDWERVEVWSDAQTGVVEFVVSDYHWRELWYKTEQGLDRIYVWALPNFHTLRPLTIKIEHGQELRDLYDREHSLYQKWHNYVYETLVERERIGAPQVSQLVRLEKNLTRLPRPILDLVARFKKLDVVKITLRTLWWTYCRYFPEAEDKKH